MNFAYVNLEVLVFLSSTPSGSCTLSASFSTGFSELIGRDLKKTSHLRPTIPGSLSFFTLGLAVDLCICSYLRQQEASLMSNPHSYSLLDFLKIALFIITVCKRINSVRILLFLLQK